MYIFIFLYVEPFEMMLEELQARVRSSLCYYLRNVLHVQSTAFAT
jgi:hypothetical protein